MTKLLCFGDSITYGYMPGGAGRFGPGERYPGLLRELLGPDFSVFEDGVCGRTTVFRGYFPAGLDDLAASVLNTAADAVVLQLGSNDCMDGYGADAEQIASGMAELVRTARSAAPDLYAILCAPPALRDEALYAWEGMSKTSLATAAALPAAYERTAAELGCGFVDGSAAAAAPADGVHPDAAGHRRLAELIASVVKNKYLLNK